MIHENDCFKQLLYILRKYMVILRAIHYSQFKHRKKRLQKDYERQKTHIHFLADRELNFSINDYCHKILILNKDLRVINKLL